MLSTYDEGILGAVGALIRTLRRLGYGRSKKMKIRKKTITDRSGLYFFFLCLMETKYPDLWHTMWGAFEIFSGQWVYQEIYQLNFLRSQIITNITYRWSEGVISSPSPVFHPGIEAGLEAESKSRPEGSHGSTWALMGANSTWGPVSVLRSLCVQTPHRLHALS